MSSTPDPVVAQALALREADPRRPALDILDEVLQPLRGTSPAFIEDADDDPMLPPARFAQLLREAFDPQMPVELFATRGGANPDAFWPRWEVQVVERFARRYGLWGVPASDASRAPPAAGAPRVDADLRPHVRALLDRASQHYRHCLRHAPKAIRYLADRGIGGAVAARFGLGYASDDRWGLRPILEDEADDTIQASGLLTQGERRVDRFRDRIMFPVRSVDGAIAGFGGRVLGDGEPKYLNSPDSEVFRKRELLYGLYESRAAIESRRRAIVVEGYFDVITLTQAGIDGAVSSLGTACTRPQLEQLFALAHRLVFCFDGDAAGQEAARRALRTVLPLAIDGREVDFVRLPDGHDPDSLVRAQGRAAFEAALNQAVPLDTFLKQQLTEGCPLQYAEGRALSAHRAGELWRSMPDGEVRDGLLSFVARLLQIDMEEVQELWMASVS